MAGETGADLGSPLRSPGARRLLWRAPVTPSLSQCSPVYAETLTVLLTLTPQTVPLNVADPLEAVLLKLKL